MFLPAEAVGHQQLKGANRMAVVRRLCLDPGMSRSDLSVALGSSAAETWANEPWVDAQWDKVKSRFVDQGVAVILGEYGAYAKPEYPA